MKEALIQSSIINRGYEAGYTIFPTEFRGQRGCPDLVVFKEGRDGTPWLEVKTPVGVLSEHQKLIIAVMQRCNQTVYVVTSADEALECLKEFYGNKADEETQTTPGHELQDQARPRLVDNSSCPVPVKRSGRVRKSAVENNNH